MRNAMILVVDDEPQIRRVLRVSLSTQGYIVDDAGSGEEALDRLRSLHPDVILLDVTMPGMSGVETCRLIRETSDAGIIMVTVRMSEEDKVAALDAGADDFVTKPFRMPELLARIRCHLRRVHISGHAREAFAFDNVQVNLATRLVLVSGEQRRLTPKEFELLRYLLTNPNTVIPHAKLVRAVWGPDHRDHPQHLRVFVNRLRKKIETDHANPRYILTEPWIGYKFRLAEHTIEEG
jgi:two-component system, OmpR family, KDP operon response regulator KdpE